MLKPTGIQKGVLATISNGTYPFALNIRIDNDTGAIVEDDGFNIQHTNTIIVIGRIVTNNDFIIFGINGNKTGIWLVNNGKFEPIINSIYLGLHIDHPIEGDFTYDVQGNITIVWTDNYNPIRYLNLGCNSLKLDVNKEFINPTNVKLLNLFPVASIPNWTLNTFEFGSLLSGAYQLAIAYVNGNDITNYISLSNWITITSKEKITGFSSYDGDTTGLKTTKAINILLTDLDVNYSKIHISLLRKVNGVVAAFNVGEYEYTGETKRIIITGNESWDSIAIEDIIVSNDTYYKAKTIIQIQERLAIGNLSKIPEIKYQKYANNIKIGWIRQDDVAMTKINGSYRDEIYIFDKRGFKTNEVKAFYIVLRLIDGTYTQAFHIPNTQAINAYLIGSTTYNGNLVINTLPVNINTQPLISIAPTNRINQIINNATDFGRMGVWLNEDETYPDTECYDIHNATGQIGTLRNQQVRHHRFPSISQLESWSNPYVTAGVNIAGGNILILVGGDVSNGTDEFMIIDDSPGDVDNGGSFDGSNYHYTFQRVGTFNLKCDFVGNNIGSGDHARFFIELTNGAGTNVLYQQEVDGSLSGTTLTCKFDTTLTVKIGDRLRIVGGVTATVLGTGWSYNGNILGNNFLVLEDATLETLDINSKILGIKISDVYIPPSIAQYVDSWEIYYAESTLDNSLVLGQALLKRFSNGEIRAYSWDILNNKPDVKAIYTHIHLGYTLDPNTNFLLHNTHVAAEQLNLVTNSDYYPADVPNGDEERVKMEVNDFVLAAGTNYYLADLMLVKRNLFLEVYNQNLIATGHSFKVNVTNVAKLYGGDIFISVFGWRIHADYLTDIQRFGGGTYSPNDGEVLNYSVLLFAHESYANIGMRYYDDVLKEKYAPKDLIISNVGGNQGKSYDSTYHSKNDTIKLIGAWCKDSCDNDITNFPYRIARSTVKGTESKTFNWRAFKANDYYDMPKNKGVIWKLNVLKDTLIIHTEHSYYIAYMKDRLLTDVLEIYLGQVDIFDRKPDEPVSVIEGYAGCRSQWSSIITPHGEIFVDIERSAIYLFNGKLDDIGTSIQIWLNQMLLEVTDNPFNNKGVTCGYDDYYDRVFVTYLGIENSWTLSYSFNTKSWISYHTFFPNVYMSNYNKLWSVANNDGFAQIVYAEHNDLQSISHYFENKQNSYIDVYFKYKERMELQGLDWISIVKDTITDDEDFAVTIKSVMVYTANQCTGYVDVKPLDKFRIVNFNSRSIGNTWSISALRDIQLHKSKYSIDKFGVLQNTNLMPSTIWFKKAIIVNDYIVVRLVFNQTVNKRTYITDIIPLVVKSKR